MLYKVTVFNFESIKSRNLYDDFYKHLEEKYYKNWTWDAESKIIAQGLFAATKSLEHILAVSFVFNV